MDLYEAGRTKVVVVEDGEINGYRYSIRSMGSHPCAYVNVKETHPLCRKPCDGCEISCHGGLTYSENYLGRIGEDNYRDGGWWLGWDYAHYGDCFLLASGYSCDGKRWTLDEIREEVKSVIDQLIAAENDNGQ